LNDQSAIGDLAPRPGPGERIRRIVDWVLVPVSAGVVTNLLLSVFVGTTGFADGWSWKTIFSIGALVIAAGAKAYAEAHR
jgi:hypothetical protein